MSQKRRLLFLVGGRIVTIDREDAVILAKCKSLGVLKDHNTFYVQCKFNDGPRENLHRVIWRRKNGNFNHIIDHINGNGLDNRKSNLRESNFRLNAANSTKTGLRSSSKYKGVTKIKKAQRWQAVCDSLYLGLFDNELDAAKAYNKKAKEIYGEHARLNVVVKD